MCKPSNTHKEAPLTTAQLAKKTPNDFFVELVKDNYGMYVRKCYSYLKCQELAEDAVQEGIISAHINLASVKDVDSMGAWLYRIIVHKAIDSLRKNQRLPTFEDDFDEIISYNKNGLLNSPIWAEILNPEEEILKNEGLEQVKAAVEGLTDVYRIPLMLKDYDDFSVKEISELLNISQSNVKVRIHRGRIKLREQLSGYFFSK